MKRCLLALAVSAASAAFAAPVASADRPSYPSGCDVVLTTPSGQVGSEQGQANKVATFIRVCLGS